MTIAVTSASGQLGAAVVQALQAMDIEEQVIGLARTPSRAAGLGIEVRPGDYSDPEQLTKSLEGVDAVLLVSGNEQPDMRIQQHRNVLNAAKTAGVEKVVYTSVQGAEEGNGFSPVVQSNRQTEADVRASGMEWVIGRNGIYIEPDLESVDAYKSAGEVANCAGDAKCGYTTRPELAFAYARLLTESTNDGRTLALNGEPISQAELSAFLNTAFGTQLTFRSMSVEDYRTDRVNELGDFLGTVIAGIYEGIRQGANDTPSDYAKAAGRPHQNWDEYFASVAH
ncbi:NAD(P)H-binding protein [Demequina oxidasica]|uniref:NAD(P)H-binding protein n=1 Tax=Demequina oxidasica TaxID=676199 RepID=UPI000782CE96|nr:NAD(P)H-binding protein [Demequina oxidasica]